MNMTSNDDSKKIKTSIEKFQAKEGLFGNDLFLASTTAAKFWETFLGSLSAAQCL